MEVRTELAIRACEREGIDREILRFPVHGQLEPFGKQRL